MSESRSSPAGDPSLDGASLGSVDRTIVRRCVIVMGVLGSAGMIGVASSLYLANHYPLLLIGLSPIGRHLILVAPQVNPFAFVVVAVGRRLLFYLASFYMGRALGPSGIEWLAARAPRTGRLIGWLTRLFSRASYAVVLLLPGPAMSTIAGSAGMAPRVFIPLVTLGLVLRMLILLSIADWLREPIELVLAWIDEYWVSGTVLIVATGAAYQWIKRRRARRIERPAV